jgi:hypothetical protein
VDDVVSRLRAHGVGVLLEPTDEPWGESNAGILDPDGYPVYVTQSLEDSWIARRPAQPVTSEHDTDYDDLLMSGLDRAEARERVRGQVDDVLERWRRT